MAEDTMTTAPTDPFARTIGSPVHHDRVSPVMLPESRLPADVADWMIQRVFGATLRLATVQASAGALARDGIDETIEMLDSLIRDVRQFVFDERRPNIS